MTFFYSWVTKMTKCALIYSGDIRSFAKRENQENHLENLINPLKERAEVDCFVHTYFHDEVNNIIDCLNPKVCVLEKRNDIEEVPREWKECELLVHGSPPSIAPRLYYQLRKIYLASTFINDSYDFIAKIRFDFTFGTTLELNLNELNNGIFIPYNMDGNPDPRYGIVDTFAIGDYKNMIHYCDFFNSAVEHAQKRNDFYTELLLKDHLEGINIIRGECYWNIDNSMGKSPSE